MRDDFSEPVKRALANRVAVRCSNPECRAVTVGPQDDPTKSTSVGVAAHITAATSGGPRYDASLTSEERRGADNGIWLCQNCAKRVDTDYIHFPVALLKGWKASAELWAQSILGKPELEGSQSLVVEEVELLVTAADTGEIYLIPSEASDQLGYRWIRIGQVDFLDELDPAFAAKYRDALGALESRDFLRHVSGCYYQLTGKGFKVARQLKGLISSNSLV